MTDALMPTYNRVDLSFEAGEGPYLITDQGDRYLDFASGIATTNLGHAHPHLVRTLQEQAGKVWHVSNLWRIRESERLAERLAEATFADRCFSAIPGSRRSRPRSSWCASTTTTAASRTAIG